jgi:hypothetical protein
MKTKLSRKWWTSIGVTVGLLVVLGAVGAVVAQKPEPGDPAPGVSSPPPQKPEPGDPVPSVSSPLAPAGGPSETMAFSYQGRLMDGSVPANGNYDFIINLYDNPTLPPSLGSCTNAGTGSLLNQPVQNGIFTFYLFCSTSNSSMFTGGERWIEVQVRRTGTTTYTTLPRQPISPVPYAFSLYPWAVISSTATGGGFGSSILNIYNNNTVSTWSAFHVKSASGSAVRGESNSGNGLYGYTEDAYAVYGYDGGSTQAKGYGGYFYSANGVGVYGQSDGTRTHPNIYSPGVYGRSTNGVGVYGRSDESSVSWTSAGVMGYGYANPGGKFFSYSGNPIEAWEDQYGDGYTLNLRFKVDYSGNVYADGTYYGAGGVSAGSADFAEMVPPGQTELEPGDVLAIGPDGQMIRTSEPYQSTVAGVYSTEPGFIAGNKLDKEGNPLEPERIPLAVVGVVPVKASAENGSIRPGDLLTTSSTPGHAMKAGPNPPVGTVIGKALGTLAEGTGVIQMLVTLQ